MIYTAEELTNEDYRALPEISGSALTTIHNDCPAAWRYGEPKASPVLADGIAAHVALLEHQDFAARYYRDIDPAEHPEALDTAKDMQAWLKEAGIKGYSNKTKPELIDMILATGEVPLIIDLMREKAAQAAGDAAPLKPAVYDRIDLMRRTVRNSPLYDEMLTGGRAELSVVRSDSGLKCRFDYLSMDGAIIDYKTTVTAHPEQFGAQAYKLGYWLKMALQHDLYEAEFGEPPQAVILLAQSKTAPYICQAYQLTDEQLDVGREQYQAAKRLYDRCKETDSWPAYGGGVQELFTPGWAARECGIELDALEIIDG